MELSAALQLIMARESLRVEDIASKTNTSYWTIRNLALGKSRPRPILLDALKRELPGLSDLLAGTAVA